MSFSSGNPTFCARMSRQGFGFLVVLLGVIVAGEATAENRLARETSPYLRLHAHNPVDWYPWGEEALEKAQRENKIIFLSVGYSSCYWCHVMERESFMDQEIAKYLNDHFVCVKVDREERPDIDAIYMLAVQLQTGRGGWPMTVFMTPQAKPFFGGTYFPARTGDRGQATGFFTILQTLHGLWEEPERRKELELRANQFTEAIQANLDLETEDIQAAPDQSLVDDVQRALTQEFDPQYGGFGFDPGEPTRPKFPEPSNLLLLLQRARSGDQRAREMVEVSLDKMHAGGIWDHVGGGFHRYSVDRFWRIPHFEKMLYDNAQLIVVYTQAHALTGKEAYQRVVERTVDFVLREMRDRQGGFYSALDAESEKVEGKFYRWQRPELEQTLAADYASYAKIYGLDGEPNFEHEFYVPQRQQTLAAFAKQQNTTESALWQSLAPMHAKLLAVRNQRPRPLTDTKILASWNGMMIRALADAGSAFSRADYLQAAQEAADFIWQHMRAEDGRLFRTHTAGVAKLNAYLDDYACVGDGLLALHRATGGAQWLTRAEQLTQTQVRLFADQQRGGFFFTSSDHEALIARGKQWSDGPVPAGNSVSVENLTYLADQLSRTEYADLAQAARVAAAPKIRRSLRIAPRMTMAIAEALAEPAQAAP